MPTTDYINSKRISIADDFFHEEHKCLRVSSPFLLDNPQWFIEEAVNQGVMEEDTPYFYNTTSAMFFVKTKNIVVAYTVTQFKLHILENGDRITWPTIDRDNYRELSRLCKNKKPLEQWEEVEVKKLFTFDTTNGTLKFHTGCFPWLRSLGYEDWYCSKRGG